MAELRVVEWTPNSTWLVAVTGKDGSYTPVIELHPEGDGTKPTFSNQVYQAAKLAADKGADALNNTHAMIGRDCRCQDCFCCAAKLVYDKIHQAVR